MRVEFAERKGVELEECGSVGGTVLSGLKILAQIMKGVQDVIGTISVGGAAGDGLESWFGGDKVRKHTFTSYKVSNPNRPYTYSPDKKTFWNYGNKKGYFFT
ncbi:hypothetical protein M2306_000591 [Myroides gitamensis]|uniref:Uncharacterized protein n=1 Tax=Myroides odoratus TaxID=256 RepID=A0A378RQK3_MYROD|nr:hypothetical protein [Myroides odoratus]MCS4237830.1 hypothetical protein [Myroides odoratus]MDH6599897.1 hypothetical protein [Myroides gitamensis]QQU04622.1 hypothetical protein I6I89_04860 [Myroides odoratus]STZ27940.1 Uncharacterised protein [Myroides odoratus]